ncbi:MAG: Kdo hydroxylase family protein, partial [Bryobacteraceae bacterium]
MNPNATSDNISRLIRLPAAIPSSLAGPAERGRWLCEQLESGNILLFSSNPFPLSSEDREFLLGLRQTSAQFHKNIAYRPLEDRLTGLDRHEPPERVERLRAILRKFSDDVTQSLSAMLPAYAAGLRRDFASFRPLEERGRSLRLRARNDLLHTDAFPTRPTHGD